MACFSLSLIPSSPSPHHIMPLVVIIVSHDFKNLEEKVSQYVARAILAVLFGQVLASFVFHLSEISKSKQTYQKRSYGEPSTRPPPPGIPNYLLEEVDLNSSVSSND